MKDGLAPSGCWSADATVLPRRWSSSALHAQAAAHILGKVQERQYCRTRVPGKSVMQEAPRQVHLHHRCQSCTGAAAGGSGFARCRPPEQRRPLLQWGCCPAAAPQACTLCAAAPVPDSLHPAMAKHVAQYTETEWPSDAAADLPGGAVPTLDLLATATAEALLVAQGNEWLSQRKPCQGVQCACQGSLHPATADAACLGPAEKPQRPDLLSLTGSWQIMSP